MRLMIITASSLWCISLFGQQNQPSRDQNSPTAPANPSMTLGDPHERGQGIAPASEKGAAYDTWPEKQKLSVSKAMGHDLGKASSSKRAEVWAKMTVQEKAEAYDYYFAHQKKPGKAKD